MLFAFMSSLSGCNKVEVDFEDIFRIDNTEAIQPIDTDSLFGETSQNVYISDNALLAILEKNYKDYDLASEITYAAIINGWEQLAGIANVDGNDNDIGWPDIDFNKYSMVVIHQYGGYDRITNQRALLKDVDVQLYFEMQERQIIFFPPAPVILYWAIYPKLPDDDSVDIFIWKNY